MLRKRWMVGVTALTLTIMIGVGSGNKPDSHPAVVQQTTPATVQIAPVQQVVTTTSTTSTTTSTSTTEVPLVSDPLDFIDEQRQLHGRCGEWHDLAMEVGWQESEWETLSTVLYTESRCTVDAWNGHDAGLSQINQIHTSWLNEMGLSHPDDMFDPRKNLWFAYKLYSSREEKGLCGWKPWSEPCT